MSNHVSTLEKVDVHKSIFETQISIRVKMLVFFTLMFSVVFALAFYWFYDFSTQLAMDGLARDLTAIAEQAAVNINGDEHQTLYEDTALPDGGRPLEDERYLDVVSLLDLIKKTQGMAVDSQGNEIFRVLLYTYVATDEPGVVKFVGSSSALNDPPSGAEFRKSYEPQSGAMRDGLNRTTVNISEPITDQWGIWVSGFTPIHNSQGDIVGAVGVDMRDTTVVALQNRIKNAVIPAFLITYVALFVAVYLISYGITRPIAKLTKMAGSIAEGNYDINLSSVATDRFPDEIGQLAEVFQLMVNKVRIREETLKKQVADLKIEIDQTKRNQQVGEIVGTDFFQDLQAKAKAMRRRRGGSKGSKPVEEDNPGSS
ncbi:MAG: HAMP domain-containing protein [Anaerolineae bacterium]|nr:HAMP domain-containing protein [Anaerolineae bacterium]